MVEGASATYRSLAAVDDERPRYNACGAAANDRLGDVVREPKRARRRSMDSALYKAEKTKVLSLRNRLHDVGEDISVTIMQLFSKDDQDWKLGDFQAATIAFEAAERTLAKLAWPGSRLR